MYIYIFTVLRKKGWLFFYIYIYILSMCLCKYASLTLVVLFRFVVIDLSAGPCTYGKIEAEEGSVSFRSLPRLQSVIRSKSSRTFADQSSHDIFLGQLASLISTTVEHVIAPDVRYLWIVISSWT